MRPLAMALRVSWGVVSGGDLPSWFGPMSLVATAMPSGLSCITTSNACTITDLSPTKPQKVTLQVEEGGVFGPQVGSPQSVAPVSSKLTVTAVPAVTSGMVHAVIRGVLPQTGVSLSLAGATSSCATDDLEQCSVTMSVQSPGAYVLHATVIGQHASTPVWVPAITVPAIAQHGKSFTVSIQHAPPKAAVVITTNDGRTINATTNAAGGASVAIKTTVRAFLTVTVSIAGTSFPAYNVQVS